MRKLPVVVLVIIAFLIAWGCYFEYKSSSKPHVVKHKMIKEITVEYAITDSLYWNYGIYKQVLRKYNYPYNEAVDHTFHSLDWAECVTTYINEYGDTVCIEYVDMFFKSRIKEYKKICR